MTIRPGSAADAAAVHQLLVAAFGGPDEAMLADRLHARADVFSLVADHDGAVIGVIVFSPVSGRGGQTGLHAVGLAPMAVHPHWQRRGVGSALVCAGIDECRARRLGLIVVLGHPGYYPRFGFRPAGATGLRCRWSHDDESFMYLELHPGQATRAGDLVVYGPEFDPF